MKGLALFLMLACVTSDSAMAARHPELIQPGKTQSSKLGELLGKPMRVVREGPTREYFFYRLGTGATMDATVHVRAGVVDYVTYICNDSIKDIQAKFANSQRFERVVRKTGNAYVGALTQVTYPDLGRGFIYEPKTKKVRACVAWEPGKRLDQIEN